MMENVMKLHRSSGVKGLNENEMKKFVQCC